MYLNKILADGESRRLPFVHPVISNPSIQYIHIYVYTPGAFHLPKIPIHFLLLPFLCCQK